MSLVRIVASVYSRASSWGVERRSTQNAVGAFTRRRLSSNNTGLPVDATGERLLQAKTTERSSTSPRESSALENESEQTDSTIPSRPETSDQSDFPTLFESSPLAAELGRGTLLRGRVVSAQLPYIRVDFGLKREVPFLPAEILGEGKVGDEVIMPLIAIEDDFQEPVLDYSGQYYKPLLMAERYRLLEPPAADEQENELNQGKPRFLFGRISSLKRGGFNTKILGIEAFLPRKQSLVLVRRDDAASANPFIGSYMPFVLLSSNFFVEGAEGTSSSGPSGAISAPGGRSSVSAYGTKRVRVLPVVSNYASFLYILVDLLHHAERYGLSPEERVAYLRLLTRLLWNRNSNVRRLHVTRTIARVEALLQDALLKAEPSGHTDSRASRARDSTTSRDHESSRVGVFQARPLSETRGSAVAQETMQSRRKRASLLRELAEKKESDPEK